MVTSPITPAAGATLHPTARYYQDSGKIGILGPLLMVVLALPATLIFGLVYGFAIYYIPFIYFNFFITLFYGG
ncbi:MAG: hypothetical protein KDE19_22105, partial [Caldilineaceae bacterium]|nr:hypothetical protein [Caldilineaceae bacterium]